MSMIDNLQEQYVLAKMKNQGATIEEIQIMKAYFNARNSLIVVKKMLGVDAIADKYLA